jgi:hypothetical protein
MEKINVKKADLLKKLETNLVLHKTVYEESMVAFKRNYLSLLGEMVKKGKKNKFEFNIALQKPQNFTQNYKNAIYMVKMDCRDIIVLSEEEFMKYVLNKWEWMRTFRSAYMSNTTYGISGMSGTSGSSGTSGMSASAKQYFGDDDE